MLSPPCPETQGYSNITAKYIFTEATFSRGLANKLVWIANMQPLHYMHPYYHVNEDTCKGIFMRVVFDTVPL